MYVAQNGKLYVGIPPKNRINKQLPLLLQILAVIKFTLVYETRAKANPGHID